VRNEPYHPATPPAHARPDGEEPILVRLFAVGTWRLETGMFLSAPKEKRISHNFAKRTHCQISEHALLAKGGAGAFLRR
jgi:hypothetical protein